MKNGNLEALIMKYPITNHDWELNNANVLNESIRNAVFYYRSDKLMNLPNSMDYSFNLSLTRRLVDAETRYIGVYDHFVRRLKRNDNNLVNILVDAWGREFPKYHDSWGKNWGLLFKLSGENRVPYDDGCELRDGNDVLVCKITVSSIEGRAIYFLDVFE